MTYEQTHGVEIDEDSKETMAKAFGRHGTFEYVSRRARRNDIDHAKLMEIEHMMKAESKIGDEALEKTKEVTFNHVAGAQISRTMLTGALKLYSDYVT